MKKNKKSKIFMILSLVCSISLFSAVTYAWVARSWTPKLEYDKVTIATAGALVISIPDKDGNDAEFNEVNLNELTGIESFALKQVSSADGKAFVGADFSPVLENLVPVYSDDVEGKYLETQFWLKAQPSNDSTLSNIKDVFIHSDTMISYTNAEGESLEVEKAIRISIELSGINNSIPYIFYQDRRPGEEPDPNDEDGKDGIYHNTFFASSPDFIGKSVFKDYPNDLSVNDQATHTQKVYKLDYFKDNPETPELDPNIFFRINSDTIQKVTVRIWLEGCDEHCQTEIAGKTFSLVLKFDSIPVELNTQQ